MPAVVSLSEKGVFTALRTVLLAWLPAGIEVFRAQANRVPQPIGTDYCTMTPVFRQRLDTNVVTFSDGFHQGQLTTRTDTQATQFSIQIDVYGPASGDNVQVVAALMRSDAAVDVFAAANPAVAPLFAGEPRQNPFADGEQQVEEHWSVDLSLQANIAVTTPQEFADTVAVATRKVVV